MRTLSVVVPATDRPPTLPACLAAIERATGNDEIVVVDGPPGLSACAARNAGARSATGDVLVFVDSDVEIHPDALDRIKAAFAARPELTAVFGSYDDAPPARGTVAAFRNLLHHHVHQGAAGPAETFWSGLGAVRRDAFLAAGGFDADRFPHPSVEDIDLGVRLASNGAHILLDPTIQGTHLKAWTLRNMLFTDFARRGLPWVALQLRSGRVSTALNLGWRHRLSAAACTFGTLAVLAGRPRAVAASVLVLLGLNRDFYALLARRRGLAEAVVGVGLHALHHLAGVASVPAGILAHARERRSSAVRGDG
ncbi:MAG: glycosyltransferase family 2 protein [Pseudonocardiaceae bacterium]